MKRIIPILLCTAVILPLLLLTSCTMGKVKYTATSYTVFDTHSVIIGYEEDEETFDKIAQRILDELSEYHRLYDIYYEYEDINNLKTVNDNAGIAPVTVDQRIIDLLLFAKEMYAVSQGQVNVAMGSVLSLWHEYREKGLAAPEKAELPPKEELSKRGSHTDINKVIIDPQKKTVYLEDPEMSLDVGAVAKGYAVEKIAQRMEKEGIKGYALSIGGNVRCVGPKAFGKDWSIGVQSPDPNSESGYVASVLIENGALVTSGTYQRFYTVSNKEYHHIIDPDTLFPGERYLSVSVLCKDSGIADALSTALFNMSEDAGRELLSTMEDTEAAWIYPDQSISYTEGFENAMEK